MNWRKARVSKCECQRKCEQFTGQFRCMAALASVCGRAGMWGCASHGVSRHICSTVPTACASSVGGVHTSGIQPSISLVSPGRWVHHVDTASFVANLTEPSHDDVGEVHVCILDEKHTGIEVDNNVVGSNHTAPSPIKTQVQVGDPYGLVVIHEIFEYRHYTLSVCACGRVQSFWKRLCAVSLRNSTRSQIETERHGLYTFNVRMSILLHFECVDTRICAGLRKQARSSVPIA